MLINSNIWVEVNVDINMKIWKKNFYFESIWVIKNFQPLNGWVGLKSANMMMGEGRG